MDAMGSLLPLDASLPPRRICFNAQLRLDFACTMDDRSAAITALHAADANGLVDRTWVDRCPLLAKLSSDPEAADIFDNVRARAARVSAALDSPLP